ncbi:acyltransferase family protein [Chloroflexota bacterium]
MNSIDSSQNGTVTGQEASTKKSTRLHYLDWLQVLAVLGVFLFHAVHPFDDLYPWHIKNAESSALVDIFVGFFASWGMPFFFLMAGATSWFSLRRRTAGRYLSERVTRLLIPYIVGAIVLTPIQAYYELIHKGWWKNGSIVEFILSSEDRTYFYTEFTQISLSPQIFGDLGYHLWFVAFLFAYALIALPVFLWLNAPSGKRFILRLAALAKWRGSLLVFVIPLIFTRLILQPLFPDLNGWSDFTFMLLFFILGYILITEERFTQAIRRDWLLHLIVGIACMSFFIFMPVYDWIGSPATPGFYLSWSLHAINSWCWTMFIFYIGMRYLDFTNKSLHYAREASYPFFFIHQPMIIFIAFYAVQWQVPLSVKLLAVVIGSLVISLGCYELFIRRINPVRALFGMKPRKSKANNNARKI